MSDKKDTAPSLSLLFLGAIDTGKTDLAQQVLAALRAGGANVSTFNTAAQPFLGDPAAYTGLEGAPSAPAGGKPSKPGLH